jgi:ABC-type antimicrobial peptide transport system ATPase subunit
MFFIRPLLSLEKHLGVTNSPHFPLLTGYITLPAYGKSLPFKTHVPSQPGTAPVSALLFLVYSLDISDRFVAHLSIRACPELRAHYR